MTSHIHFSPFCVLKKYKTAELDEIVGRLKDKVQEWGLRSVITWRGECRPYYNVYPVILQSLLRTDLSKVKIADLVFPEGLNSLSFRFCSKSGRNPLVITRAKNGIVFTEQVDAENFRILVRVDENVCSNIPEDWKEALQITVGSLMLDAEFVERDMNEREKDRPLIYFKKINKFGWNVGAAVEKESRVVGVHFRRPHLAIRWCGSKTEKRPVLTRISGSIVNRKRLTEIPTGYEGFL